MAITFKRAADFARHVLGLSPDSDPEYFSASDLVNEAGEQLATMHRWRWLSAATANVTFPAGVGQAPLPSDFSEIIGITVNDRLIGDAHRLSLTDILHLRENSSQAVSPHHFWWALGYDRTTPGEPVPVLEVYPIDASARTDYAAVMYRAKWRTTIEGENLTLPSWCEGLYLEVLRAVALGWSEPEGGSMAARIQEIAGSDLLLRARRVDGRAMGGLGPEEKGYGMIGDEKHDWREGYLDAEFGGLT